jgi:hypothetical protein
MATYVSQGIKHKSYRIPNFFKSFCSKSRGGRMPASEIHIIRTRRDSKRGRRTREALRLDSAEIVL